ncbi:MAG: iron-containing alcohol dehydrogenase [Clostridia bacterium]
MLSGIAMGYAGNSRPASGSEHHMSHFWEMDFLFRGKKAVLHGIKVGIGTVVSCKLYEYLRSLSLEEIKGRQMEREPFNRQRWEKEMRRVYQSAADGIIRLEVEAEKNEESKRAVRIKSNSGPLDANSE